MGDSRIISGERGGGGGTGVRAGPSLTMVVVLKERESGKRGGVALCMFCADIGVRTVFVCSGVCVLLDWKRRYSAD